MNNAEFNEDLFLGLGIKVEIKTSFNQIREVLTRIGIESHKNKTITQTCHIFHKRNQYAIMHFKEMFLFDGKESNFNLEDQNRRDFIVKLLYEWGHIEILEDSEDIEEILNIDNFNKNISILSRDIIQEEGWKQVSKYTLGKKKHHEKEESKEE